MVQTATALVCPQRNTGADFGINKRRCSTRRHTSLAGEDENETNGAYAVVRLRPRSSGRRGPHTDAASRRYSPVLYCGRRRRGQKSVTSAPAKTGSGQSDLFRLGERLSPAEGCHRGGRQDAEPLGFDRSTVRSGLRAVHSRGSTDCCTRRSRRQRPRSRPPPFRRATLHRGHRSRFAVSVPAKPRTVARTTPQHNLIRVQVPEYAAT